MSKPSHVGSRAFTLIELLVVVAIIALLISILLPSLNDARNQGKKAKCLSNFRTLVNGAVLYASEDKKEQPVGIQQNHVSQYAQDGFGGNDGWLRIGLPYTFGGRTATIPFFNGGGKVNQFNDDKGRWAARTRPLNLYILGGPANVASGDSKKLEWFRCPGDKGYPTNSKADITECKPENRGRPLYDLVGNSYRTNFAGFFIDSGQYTVAGWGHRISTLGVTSRLALYSEALFYTMAFPGNDIAGTVRGWHGKFMHDNVAYADGSARYTKCEGLQTFDSKDLKKMNVTDSVPQNYILRRGGNWQTDAYPTPMAVIPWRDKSGKDNHQRPGKNWSFGDETMWPYANFQDNMVER